MENLGIEVSPERNESTVGEEGFVSTEESPTRVGVIPTEEELVIARDTCRCVNPE